MGKSLEYLELVVAVIGVVVWLVRLEGKLLQQERLVTEAQKDIDVLRTQHEGVYAKIADQLSAVRESLARLEGKLGIKGE